MSRAGSINGKVITFILVVLLALGITAVALFFIMRENGITYYVEYNGERYLADSEGGNLWLPPSDNL